MTQAQVLLFSAGGLRLGVFLADVGRLVVEDAVYAVPYTHPALAGLLMAGDDGPIPVFDLRGLVEGAVVPPATGRSNVAIFPTARGPVGLRLDQLDGTADRYEAIDVQAVGDLHAGAAPALLATVTGAARAAGGTFFFFSPDAFLGALGL